MKDKKNKAEPMEEPDKPISSMKILEPSAFSKKHEIKENNNYWIIYEQSGRPMALFKSEISAKNFMGKLIKRGVVKALGDTLWEDKEGTTYGLVVLGVNK